MSKSLKALTGIAAALFLIGFAFFLFNSFSDDESQSLTVNSAKEHKLTIVTSILPQEYFVDRIGGDRVQVQALVTPGSSPATYEPSPRQMAALSEAELFFRIGVPFENAFIPKIDSMTKQLHIVDTRKGITIKGNDPHIWLSPRLVKLQARTIAEAIIEKDPAGKADYEKNLAELLKDLDALDALLTKALVPVKGKTFMVFHPSWGYFADAYGLEQQSIEVEGKEPSGRQLIRMVELSQNEDVRVIFVQPQFNMASANRIAKAINGVVVPIDPLARDYIGNLQQVATTVLEALQQQD
ncbi:metal ABC transporter solute-binding protein, Zn/Mn family [Shewanella saliphila]|uniref:High-affinity zinc uptake system protein ZnuA n=1 Tax=Shewanella saliphila TaxID=2282698 RepID=A0ABQ2QCK7_9GAMM|nr:zinc ABC transporter substrate-binding protein [Shewanella saliphila]MCL1103363.1 zinc ABC transporter substrate-binding protein [Shewanella saliphila]GGP68916.1 ABC transporter substrate-binding protein [Shewanella saliphila]